MLVVSLFFQFAPYTDPEQVKEIFFFLIRQSGGLKDPKKQPIHRRLDKRTACWLDRQAIWIENLKNDQSRKNPPSSTFCFC